jgi:hypothetical protein
MAKKVGDWYYYAGVVHVHTTESDGTRSLEDVVELGRQVGLDFIMFADHMTLSNRDNGKEGFYGDTLVVVGYEHNDPHDKHHYLLFGSPRVYPRDMAVSEYVAAGAADRAVGIIAHPDEIRSKLIEYPPYPWQDWDLDGYTGIELWNQMSEWMEKLTRFNKLLMSLSPRKSMVGPTDRILRKWDALSMTRKTAGLASVDAHAFPVKAGPLTVEIFPYKVHFRTLRTYAILKQPISKDFAVARVQLLDAIRDCRLFFANVRWGNAEGFQFFATDGSQTATCGGQVYLSENTYLHTRLPLRATVRLIHNGQKVLETTTDILEYKAPQEGIYRVEAWKGKRGWIFSNHVRVIRQ